MSDVLLADGTKDGVRDGVAQHVGVGVTFQSAVMRNLDPAKH